MQHLLQYNTVIDLLTLFLSGVWISSSQNDVQMKYCWSVVIEVMYVITYMYVQLWKLL